MLDFRSVHCPHCAQPIELAVDPSARGEMIQDCDVCCRPIVIRIGPASSWAQDEDGVGEPVLHIERGQ